MFSALRRAFARKPANRRKSAPGRKPNNQARLGNINDWLLEKRWCLATDITIEPLPDIDLTAADTALPALQFTMQGTDHRSAVNKVVIDDVPQGVFNSVQSASLFYETAPDVWTFLDSSPPTAANGKQVVFNNFGWIPVAGNGERFQVRLDAINSLLGSRDVDLSFVDANVRYAGAYSPGKFSFSATPTVGDNRDDTWPRIQGGFQRTTYSFNPLADTNVTGADRDKVVLDMYVHSSDRRAFARCFRFTDKDGGNLQFLRSATLQVETSPGTWDSLMTRTPDAYGRLIFTIANVGRTVATGGAGAHLRVVVDAYPDLAGSQPVNIGLYYSTSPYAGSKSYTTLNTDIPLPPIPPGPTHGTLSTSSLFYNMSPGVNQLAMQVNVGIGPNAFFNRLEIHVGSGTFSGSTGFRLYRCDSNGVPLNQFPVLGTVTFNDGNTVIIDNINWIIDAPSNQFALYVDVANPFQIGSVFANG